jgi:hypothetical protein
VYSLAPTGNSTLQAGGSATVNIACGVEVDSTGSNALKVNGTACLNATAIAVAGDYSGCTNPTPATGAVVAGDPLAYLAAPSVGACDFGTGSSSFDYHAGGTITIDPGVYCGGMKITNGIVNLNPGLYILKGGGLSMSGGSTLNGNGVTIYNTCNSGSCASSTAGYDQINLAGGTNATLSAPTGGTWAGMLFFTDRNAPNQTNTINGGTTLSLTGTFYMPSQDVKFAGTSTAALYTNLVAWTINFIGDTTINYNISSLPAGSPIKTVALVE